MLIAINHLALCKPILYNVFVGEDSKSIYVSTAEFLKSIVCFLKNNMQFPTRFEDPLYTWTSNDCVSK